MNASLRSAGVALVLTALVVTGAAAEEPKVRELLQGSEGTPAADDTAKKATKPAKPPGPPDDFDRGVPRTTVEGFLSSTKEADWGRAAEYLDTRGLPTSFRTREASELARQLAFVLDRFLWIHPETLSAEPEGHAVVRRGR